MDGEMQGKYYQYCSISRSIRYSTDLNSKNNKFDLETFDLVSEYYIKVNATTTVEANKLNYATYDYRRAVL
eukprot:COSAG05_NODE_659_length_8055_cov_3.528406_5_plen_71_part_00